MTYRMGIIGAENSHSAGIAKIINIDKKIRGIAVTHLWGETRAFAEATATAGAIPTIVKKPTDLLGAVDCVMIDHRDGKHHLAAAIPFIKAGIPCFIDKPFSTSTAEAKRFLKLRHDRKVAVTSFSSVPHFSCVKTIKQRLKALGPLKSVNLYGPGDHRSPYSGIFFYGIHLTDLMVELFGSGVQSVQAAINGDSCSVLCHYPANLTVGLSILPGHKGWTVMAVGAKGSELLPLTADEAGHLSSVKKFVGMFRTGKEPYSDERLLAPIAVLEAAQLSCRDQRRRRIRL